MPGTFKLLVSAVGSKSGDWSGSVDATDADIILGVNHTKSCISGSGDCFACAVDETTTPGSIHFTVTAIVLDEGTVDEQTLSSSADLPAGFKAVSAKASGRAVQATGATNPVFLRFDALTESAALPVAELPGTIVELAYDFTPPFEPSILTIIANGWGLRVAVGNPGDLMVFGSAGNYPTGPAEFFGITGLYEIEADVFYNPAIDEYNPVDNAGTLVDPPDPVVIAVVANSLAEIDLTTPTPRHLTATVANAVLGSTGGIITVFGQGFVTGCTVKVNGLSATGVVYVNSHQLTCIAPVYPDNYDESVDFMDDDGELLGVPSASPGAVKVTNPDAQDGSLANGVVYFTAPEVLTFLGVVPDSGTSSGGTRVTIFGGGFTTVTSVKFDGTPATDLRIVSQFEMNCLTPAHSADVVDILITAT